MSNTIRNRPHYIIFTEEDKEKDFTRDNKSIRTYHTGRRMKTYTVNNKRSKYGVEPGLGTGISKLGKLVTKNANRALKKQARQQLKKDLKRQIDETLCK